MRVNLFVDPAINGGRLSFENAVSVWAVAGRITAGVAIVDVAADFNLDPEDVADVLKGLDGLPSGV